MVLIFQELRLAMLPQNFNFPTRNKVDDYKSSLLPDHVISDDTKTSSPVIEVIENTVNSLCNLSDKPEITEVYVSAKYGLDGSGSHSYRHQLSGDAETTDTEAKDNNYIGSFWCPLDIKDKDENVLWKNPLPNSILYARPTALVKAKETRENIKEHFEPTLDDLVAMENVPFLSSSGRLMHVKTEISMVDGKMVDLLMGDSGSFCHYCNVTRLKANQLHEILQKNFNIEKSYEEIMKTWEALENGDIAYNDPLRHGQCHAPILKKDIKFFAVLHQKLRGLDHCLKIHYHLTSGQTHTWSEANPRVKNALKIGKEEVIRVVREKCGFQLDTPTQDGGNTNNGPIADRYFDPKNREAICSTIKNTVDRENFSILLSKYNIMLSLTQQVNSSKTVDPLKVKEVGYDLMIFLRQSFDWAMITPSVHQMCAHSWELFVVTEGKPIAKFSEQSGESWNKFIRAYKSGAACKARQMSIKLNTRDVFTRMMIKTHPVIANKKRQISCGKCCELGHTARSCRKDASTVETLERSIIGNCYV